MCTRQRNKLLIIEPHTSKHLFHSYSIHYTLAKTHTHSLSDTHTHADPYIRTLFIRNYIHVKKHTHSLSLSRTHVDPYVQNPISFVHHELHTRTHTHSLSLSLTHTAMQTPTSKHLFYPYTINRIHEHTHTLSLSLTHTHIDPYF